jgi:hypothetical protein
MKMRSTTAAVAPAAASAQRRRRVNAGDRGGIARPAYDARQRGRLAVNDPQLVAALGGDLCEPVGARRRIVRDRLAHEGGCPVGKRLDVGWGDHPRVPRRTRIVRLLLQHVNLVRDGLEGRQAALDSPLGKPRRRLFGTPTPG